MISYLKNDLFSYARMLNDIKYYIYIPDITRLSFVQK